MIDFVHFSSSGYRSFFRVVLDQVKARYPGFSSANEQCLKKFCEIGSEGKYQEAVEYFQARVII